MISIAFIIFIILGAIIHEYSHGWMADKLGDPTARLAGRLTLNPIAHLDPFGSFLLPLILWFFSLLSGGRGIIFAYAKPVPFNPYNLKNQRYGPAYIGIAGPLSNFLIAFILGILVRFLPAGYFSVMLGIGAFANILLGVFNLVPIPPLDGSKLLFAILPESMKLVKLFLERYGIFILIFFIFYAFGIIFPIMTWLLFLFTGQEMGLMVLNCIFKGACLL